MTSLFSFLEKQNEKNEVPLFLRALLVHIVACTACAYCFMRALLVHIGMRALLVHFVFLPH
jgi:hypothetical protein